LHLQNVMSMSVDRIQLNGFNPCFRLVPLQLYYGTYRKLMVTFFRKSQFSEGFMQISKTVSAIILSLGFACSRQVEANDQLIDRLRLEGPPAWNQVDREYDPASGEYVLKIFEKEKSVVKPIRSRRYLFFRKGQNIRCDRYVDQIAELRNSILVNEEYAAHVTKSANSDSFQASWIGTRSEGPKLLDEVTNYYSALRSGTMLLGKPLQEFLNHPKFRIHVIEEFEANGERLVYLKYDCLTDDPAFRINGGTLTLAPRHGWKIIDSEHFIDEGRTGAICLRTQFELDSAGRSIIKSADYFTLEFKTGFEDHTLYEFPNIAFGETPASKFRLKEFGLPEPTTAMQANHASTVHLWFVAGAILMFGIAYGLNRAARQSA
jgi:hypothetical protein